MQNVLEIKDLHLSFVSKGKEKKVLRGIDLDISEGETLGLAGESGAGKSLLTLSIMGLLPATAEIKKGGIQFQGAEILDNPGKQASLRGRKIGIIFQDPSASLDPLYRVGSQVAETLSDITGKRPEMPQILNLFSRAEFKEPEKIVFRYPHQLSGGEKQRVMIAVALAGNPRLLLADEPTASLDANTGAQIISLLSKIQKETGLSILFISHNLPLVEQIADKLAIIYAGRILETGLTTELAKRSLHPYTRLLFSALPDPGRKGKPLATIPGSPGSGLNSRISDFPSTEESGCAFYQRCPEKNLTCCRPEPPLIEISPGHRVACWRIKNEN
ncbi:MAG: ABC transporter ATP-binding protein [Candidatus Omnitrophica bacterium]|nr:ABC transporter ATP-binding protein [Candidatus Omnitrophota bacterium]